MVLLPSYKNHLSFCSASCVKSQTHLQNIIKILSDYEDILEKEMATHSSILASEIPWTEEPGGLQSMGLQKSQTWLSN